ncbi:MAG: winged helix-turn-helix transcriptional regulator [Devosia sp.]|nr:winged helix-turn-helix transcriptional regulator [Devosia sp.]
MRSATFEPGPDKRGVHFLREVNLRTVLAAIAKSPGATAAEVSRATALSASSVLRIVENLLEKDLIHEGELVRGRRGQPGQTLFMNPDGSFSIGCHFEKDRCRFLLRSLGGRVLAEHALPTSGARSSAVIGLAANAIRDLLASHPTTVSQRLAGVGAAVSSELEYGLEPGWDGLSLQAELERQTGLPVLAYSAGSAGAWAELAAIPPPRPADFLYLFFDGDLQSGFVLNGRLWTGPDGRSGSISRAMSSSSAADMNETDWSDGLSLGTLCRAVCLLCGSLGLPVVVVDGDVPPAALGLLTEAFTTAAWPGKAPSVRNGLAGKMAPVKGAALRPLYVSLFEKDLA